MNFPNAEIPLNDSEEPKVKISEPDGEPVPSVEEPMKPLTDKDNIEEEEDDENDGRDIVSIPDRPSHDQDVS